MGSNPHAVDELIMAASAYVCNNCGMIMGRLDNHCIGCGEENPHFDLEALNLRCGTTHTTREELATACNSQKHAVTIATFVMENTARPEDLKTYCPKCGIKLL